MFASVLLKRREPIPTPIIAPRYSLNNAMMASTNLLVPESRSRFAISLSATVMDRPGTRTMMDDRRQNGIFMGMPMDAMMEMMMPAELVAMISVRLSKRSRLAQKFRRKKMMSETKEAANAS